MTKAKPIGLDAIEAVPLHELVYQQLTRALMAGQIPAGRKLTSRKLAQELGTSDMPVRAALSRLQALKALTPLANGSLVLPPMTSERFADLMDARQAVESAATQRAAERLTQSELRNVRKLASALNQAAKDQDIDAYLISNYEFKFAIYRACGNESLLFLIETLWLQVGPFLRQYGDKFGGALAGILDIDFHEDVVSALASGSGAKAAAAMRRDIAEGKKYLLQHATFA